MRSDVFMGDDAVAGGVGLIEVQPASLRAAAAAAAAAATAGSGSDRMDRDKEYYPLTARSTGSICLSINSPVPAGASGGSGGYGSNYLSSGIDSMSGRGVGAAG